MDNLTPMLRQYYSIKQQHQDALLLFRLGDFYEMFGADAEIGSRVLDIALTSREMGKGKELPMCGVPYHAVEGYLAALLRAGYKVAICEQVEDPKTAKGVVKREVTRVITPGTVIEPQLLDDKANNYLTAICRHQRHYGLAVVDVSTGYFAVTEIKGTGAEDKLWNELERLAPAECLLDPSLEGDPSWKAEAARRLNCTLSPYEERGWRYAYASEVLLRHFGIKSLNSFGLEDAAAAVRAGGALLSYLNDTQRRVLSHITTVNVYSVESYMLMETATRRNLELTQTLRDGEYRGSLLWLLDGTVTAMGGRLLRQWVLQPRLDRQEIIQRLDAVEELVRDTPMRTRLREQLAGIHDLERLVGRITYESANPRDLAALGKSLEKIPGLNQILADAQEARLQELARGLEPLPELRELLRSSLIDSPPAVVRDGGLIRPGYSRELDQLRAATREGKSWIAALEAAEREKTGIKSLKVGFNKVFGYYIEVTKANLASVPGHYQRKQTLANSERYITPELKEKENLILGAEERAIQLEYELFQEIRAQVNAAAPRLLRLAAALSQLDALAALAEVAVRRRYCRPAITEDKIIDIKAGRHPVVEAMLPQGQFVPNDVYLDDETAQLLILTGPNMAGKSTYLRMAALITLMAQMGSFVPADEARIGLVDRIFTRVGAADDLGTGQSTFMVEMSEVNIALSQATSSSLIIIDELGRGTSTYDGMALAQAIAEYIHDVTGARTIFSTHYHELAKLALTRPRIKNLRMEVWEDGKEVVFLYKVAEGAADRSYGIHVARLAGLPKSVLARARSVLQDLEPEQPYQQLKLDGFFLGEAGQADDDLETAGARVPAGSSPDLQPEQGELAAGREGLAQDGEADILQRIKTADLAHMTPFEALNRLVEWQTRLRKET
ncbi:MAG: DNA mismatch repair protein MutS [Firmicutes bacterium]|jgi:DNA mismatch repair protein MutS|nr:DNA mismatch repair protein MutS [Bacillota bacterium]